MSVNTKTAAAIRASMLATFTTAAASGKLKIYSGTQPATADTAITSQVLLATLTLNATAFGAASAGVITANAITADTNAAATGTATWYRLTQSDSTTVLQDGSVGTATSNLILDTTAVVATQTVNASSFTQTMAP